MKPLKLELFRKVEGPEILTALGVARERLCRVYFPLQSPDYILSREIIARIDDLAELLTGDRKYFHAKGHSSVNYAIPDPSRRG